MGQVIMVDIRPVIETLGRDLWLDVHSSSELARQVHEEARRWSWKREAYRYRKRPNPVMLYKSAGLRTSAAQVLHELGVATTFVTKSPFTEVAHHWAHLRYCAALGAVQGRLALSRHADQVVYHHAVMQSEQLGVGLALVVAKETLRRMYPGWEFVSVDAEVTLSAGSIAGVGSVSLTKKATKRPDYFMIGRHVDGGGTVKVFVLECKGTHKERTHAIRQLATASVQVQTVRVGARTPPGLMVASTLSTSGITAYLLDPAGDDELWAGEATEMDELLAASPDDVELVQAQPTEAEVARMRAELESTADVGLLAESEPMMWDFQDDATAEPTDEARDEAGEMLSELPTVLQIPEEHRSWFFQILARTAAASALAFIGDGATAARYATRRQLGVPEPHGLLMTDVLTIEDYGSSTGSTFGLSDDLVFEGSRYSARLSGGHTVEVWRGLERSLYSHLESGRIGQYFRRAPQLRRRWSRGDSHGSFDVVSVGNDGTALAMRFT